MTISSTSPGPAAQLRTQSLWRSRLQDGLFMNSRNFFLVTSSELLSASSVAIAPGEIIVQRIFGVQFHPQPSVNARTAACGAVDRPPGANILIPKTEAMFMM